jgi:hypothetical protein
VLDPYSGTWRLQIGFPDLKTGLPNNRFESYGKRSTPVDLDEGSAASPAASHEQRQVYPANFNQSLFDPDIFETATDPIQMGPEVYAGLAAETVMRYSHYGFEGVFVETEKFWTDDLQHAVADGTSLYDQISINLTATFVVDTVQTIADEIRARDLSESRDVCDPKVHDQI